MKYSKKFFVILVLVALFTAILFTTAFASDTKLVSYASVARIKLLDDQPATFSLLGSYTCDKVQVNSSVNGKIISIYVYDIRIKHTGSGCDTGKSFKRTVGLGTLVPGKYTLLVNPDGAGRAQKKFSFTAPMLPAAVSALPTPVNP